MHPFFRLATLCVGGFCTIAGCSSSNQDSGNNSNVSRAGASASTSGGSTAVSGGPTLGGVSASGGSSPSLGGTGAAQTSRTSSIADSGGTTLGVAQGSATGGIAGTGGAQITSSGGSTWTSTGGATQGGATGGTSSSQTSTSTVVIQCVPSCAAGKLCDTTTGLCVSCLTAADCASGQVCAMGECAANPCLTDDWICTDETTYGRCATDGNSLVTSPCDFGAICVSYGGKGGAICANGGCTPGQIDCVSGYNKRVLCGADGRSYTDVDTCADTEKCTEGQCLTKICTPDAYSCVDNIISTCLGGVEQFVVERCSASEYCHTNNDTNKTINCAPKLCSPNHMSCLNNAFGMCTSSGNGLTGDSTACGDKSCSLDGCGDALFRQTFEDPFEAPLGIWSPPPEFAVASRVDAGANGTSHSLQIKLPDPFVRGEPSIGWYDGVHYSFPAAINPSRVSLWLKVVGAKATGFVVLGDSTAAGRFQWRGSSGGNLAANYPTFYIAFAADGVTFGQWREEHVAPGVNENQWIHVQLTFDWTAHWAYPQVSVIDGTGRETTPTDVERTFFADFESVARIDLFGLDAPDRPGQVFFDEIEMFP